MDAITGKAPSLFADTCMRQGMAVPRIVNPPVPLRLRALLLLGLAAPSLPAHAASSSFDLVGPRLVVTVTHGGVSLPLERVPNLAEGDRIAITIDLLPGSHEQYRLVAGFLRGSVDRPPDDWFNKARSWKSKDATLSLVVPKGAGQLALFIAPETGGSAKAIVGAIRKQPGAFVRAVQELNQASLDRARLDTFLGALQTAERKDPESVASVSPILTRSLAIKLKAECLLQPAQVQAGCLTGDRETLLLADSHSSALADTLTGTPTDLALQLSATPQGGYGAYSSYIGVVRDVFRLFGAFQSTQLQFIPALSQMGDGHVTVLLNTPLSFTKPSSVMVVAMPVVEAPNPPPLRSTAGSASLCAAPGLVLPVEGAPLVYATGYARDLELRFPLADGTQATVPVRADPGVGGFVPVGAMPGGLAASAQGRLHGSWGFPAFDGPSFALTRPDTGPWSAAADNSLVVGRDNTLTLTGDGVGCVTQVTMRGRDGAVQPLTWKQSGPKSIAANVPLDKAAPGPVSILIDGTGRATPAIVTVDAVQEIGSLDDLAVQAGDQDAVLTGTRLDQVLRVTLGTAMFKPGVLTRVGKQDRLTLRAADPTAELVSGKSMSANVAFTGGRRRTLPVTIAPPRPGVSLVNVTAQTPAHHGLPITLPADGVFAQDASIRFAFHRDAAATLSGRETIEIATLDGRTTATIQPGKGYDLQDAMTGIVAFTPIEALGPLAYGPLRFRIVHDGTESRWSQLGTVVRLPDIRGIGCSQGACSLTGERLFLIKALSVTPDFQTAQVIPDGFVATSIGVDAIPDRRLFLKLRDAPLAVATIAAGYP